LYVSAHSCSQLPVLLTYSDTTIFHSKLNSGVPERVARAVLPLGLSPSSLDALIHDLLKGATHQIAEIPGVTPEILAASNQAYKEAFVDAVRGIWITAACFAVVAVVGMDADSRVTAF
jgi:hypothetical protein